MKIGILAVSTGNPELPAGEREYPRMFVDFLNKTGVPFEYAFYDVLGKREFPNKIDECDAYLVTGSKYGAYEDIPWIHDLNGFIRRAHEARRKLIGICFGHQAVAYALGGKVSKSDKGWGVGNRAMAILSRQPWMVPGKETLNLLYSHQDQVTALPPGAIRFGRSDFCEQMAFTVSDNVLCFQGHPEFTPEYLRELMAGRISIIPAPVYQEAVDSLARPVDSAIVGRWIAAFITHKKSAT